MQHDAGSAIITFMRPYAKLSEIYDHGWADFSRRYVALLEEIFAERSLYPHDILDLACGTGTLAVELARRGYRVHGLDISPQMIEKARKKASDLGGVTFAKGNIARFQMRDRFDVVTCTFDAVNYLTQSEDAGNMFRCAARCLRKGGLLVFDSNTRHLYLSYQAETNKQEIDGTSFTQSCRFNRRQNIATTTFEFPDGTIEVHRQRPYDYKDFGPLLSAAGLQVLQLFSWFDRSPAGSDTEKLFCLARKM